MLDLGPFTPPTCTRLRVLLHRILDLVNSSELRLLAEEEGRLRREITKGNPGTTVSSSRVYGSGGGGRAYVGNLKDVRCVVYPVANQDNGRTRRGRAS